MNYWPGTNIIKSQGNAFDWRKGTSVVAKDKSIKATNNAKKQAIAASPGPNQAFTIYSKAKRAA